MSKLQDSLTSHGAGVLASAIESHWLERGHRNVRAIAEPVPGVAGHWQVRTNLSAGLPPGVRSSYGLAA